MSPVRRGPALWSSDEAIAATGGRSTRHWLAGGVSIDSRTVAAGDLFVAIRGLNVDGHNFVADALAKGAVAAIVARRADGVAADAPLLEVADTMKALEALGRAARARTAARVVAVTGSVGKTGTKEALRRVLSEQGATAASEGSYNNQWGVPLSLARMARDAAFGVFEIGMNHPGEITPLVRMARPHVAVVTAVEAAHLEFFPSLEAVADAKAEIFLGIERGGAAVLPRDNPLYTRLESAARAAGCGRVLSFGEHREASARLIGCELMPDGAKVVAQVAGRPVAYRLSVAGRHWVVNSLAVLCTVHALGADVTAAAAGLAGFAALKGRGRRHTVMVPDGTLTVIDESYNASPAAVAAAIATLGQVGRGDFGRRIAVLADMLELGAESRSRHAALAAPLRENGIDLVFLAGGETRALWDALPKPMRGGHAEDAEQLAPLVAANVRAGDVVMVKGSAGMKTGKIVQALLALGGAPNGDRDGRRNGISDRREARAANGG